MANPTSPAKTEKTEEEKTFQVYTSSMKSHRIIRPDGKPLHFNDYKYVTDDEGDIEYLDEEIRKGFRYVTKGDKVTAAEANPVLALKEQWKREAIAEYLAKEQEELKESTSDTSTVKPASTADLVAGLQVNSNSAQTK